MGKDQASEPGIERYLRGHNVFTQHLLRSFREDIILQTKLDGFQILRTIRELQLSSGF